jgi:hypothetical protein
MKSRWLLNLILFLVVAGVALFLYLTPGQKASAPTTFTVSAIDPASIEKISIEVPAKSPVTMEKRDGNWFITQPYSARAGKFMMERVLTILRANSIEKFAADDLARFGLDNPSLRLKLNDHEIVFGTFNPVNGQQYIAYNNSVYLVGSIYSEVATTQVIEFVDKAPIAFWEKIAGFDFSHLEQWQELGGLRLDLEDGKWKVSLANAKPVQDALNEWFDEGWRSLSAVSVETYKPDHKTVYPSFEVKLKNGKTIHFDKVQENPDLQLGRPDEGLIYHFQNDVGFSLLNPPIGLEKKK